MSDVAVVIGTYGVAADWIPFVQRATASAEAQTVQPKHIIWQHSDTLQHARNWGAGRAEDVEWLIFLDADDELEPSYIEAMLDGYGDIRRPSTRGVYEDGTIEEPPSLIPERPLHQANFIVIGAMLRSELFFKVGGFDDYPVLEDWECFQRMVLAGACVATVPGAVYRIHVRANSRNSDQGLHDRTYAAIRAKHADQWAIRGWQ